MPTDFSIKCNQVDVSNPDETIIHSQDLAQSLKENWDETVEDLSTGISPIGPQDIAIDTHGRVVVFNADFASNLRKVMKQNATADTDFNACGCEHGNCYKCGGG